MTRYIYNRQVEPPAPFVHVIVGRADGTGASVTIPALVDSGADKTVLPHSLVEEVGLAQVGDVQTAGFNDLGVVLGLFSARIGIRDLAPVAIDAIAAPGEEYVLLGRDVLNRHRVTLDGPSLLCLIE